MTDGYAWRGGTEMLLRHGMGSDQTVLILPALFEEANRMRHFTVSLMRALAERDIGTLLPDLPGTGESLSSLVSVTFSDWQEAVRVLVDDTRRENGRCLTIAIRAGAMLDADADFGWRLAPETGERALRDLVRSTALSSGRKAAEIDRVARLEPVMLAGQTISPELYTELSTAGMSSERRRTARLVEDIGPRDVSLQGAKIWRYAEPGTDPVLAAAAANDIADWIATCASL